MVLMLVDSFRFGAPPEEEPPQSGLVAWYRSDDVAGNDGDEVTAWADRTAGAYDLAQAGSTLKPTLQTNELNGYPVVRFDGSNDRINRATTPSITMPFTYVALAKLTDAADGGTNKAIMGDNAGATEFYYRFASTATGQISFYADTARQGNTVPDGSTWYVHEACFNRNSSFVRLNNGALETLSSAAADPGNAAVDIQAGVYLGGYGANTEFFPGDIAEVLIYNRVLRDSDRRDLLNYIFNRYGIGAAIADTDTSYGNEGGMGYRVGEPKVTTTAAITNGRIENLVDGDLAGTSSGALDFNDTQADREILFDWGVGASRIINAFKWNQSGSTANQGVWDFQGSNNASDWTTIINDLTLGGAIGETEYSGTNTTGYRYYRLLQVSGVTENAPWLIEITFKIAKAAGDTATSFWNPGGKGYRSSLITVTSDDQVGQAGPIANVVDGGEAGSSTDGSDFTNWTGTYWLFDFGASASKIIDAFIWKQSTNTHTHGVWDFEGSNDGTNWTNLLNDFTLGGLFDVLYTFTNTTGYRYYRLLYVSGTVSATPWITEVEFKIKDA